MLKLKEKMMALKDATQAKAVELLPDKVPTEIQQQRWDTCNSCEKLYRPTSTCKICGCFMQVKTHLASSKCPIDKWGRVEPNQNSEL
jgi:hypothetical protein